MYDVDNSGSINVIEMAAIIRYFIHFKGFSLNALIINIVIHLYYDSFKAYRGKLQLEKTLTLWQEYAYQASSEINGSLAFTDNVKHLH